MILILQPFIPHYRENFFLELSIQSKMKIFCYQSIEDSKVNNFKSSSIDFCKIKNIKFGPFLFYDFRPILVDNTNVVVLMLDVKHITTWFLLLTKKIHKKKIILWGHGISVRKYLKHDKQVFIPLKLMLKLSDGVWFYTKRELDIWKGRIPNLNAVSLNNTISDVDEILALDSFTKTEKAKVKNLYNIKHQFVFIYCARFNDNRRVDLMVKIIEKLDMNKFGFVIIGDGPSKPNFEKYKNVYDFGKIYDMQVKKDLFRISDAYFQPAWLGLSIVEAMAYALPIFTFKRTEEVFQCVEYSYVEDGYNGFLFESLDDFISKTTKLTFEELESLRVNAKKFAINELSMDQMVSRSMTIISKIN